MKRTGPIKPKHKRKCHGCGEQYKPWSTTQKACSITCAQKVGQKELERKQAREAKERRAELRQAKQGLKTAKVLTQELQPVFNAWVRTRDVDEPCISCGRYDHEIPDHHTGGKWDCGHYRSVGACPELRFEPLNAHKQCKYCNKDLSGNVVEYRLRLTDRIGQEALAWVEGPHEPKKYTREQLLDMRKHYLKAKRELERERKAA